MITYTDKVQNAVNPLPVTEQWRAVDANEVKTEVNANITATATAQSTANAAGSAASTAQGDIDTHEGLTNNPHSVTASQVGLGSVDNTSDASKPVSTAQQTALNLKSDLPYTIYTKNASYALLAADRTDILTGKRLLFIMDSVSAMNFTIPADATVDIPIGDWFDVIRVNTGVVTFVAGGANTVTGSAGNLLDVGQNTLMRVVKTAANAWVLQNGSSAGYYVDYTVTFGGFSVAPTSVVSRFTLVGKMCHVMIFCGGNGTSNATTYTITLPFAPEVSRTDIVGPVVNSGTAAVDPGRILFTAASTTADLHLNLQGAAWTNSGGKRANVNLIYEID